MKKLRKILGLILSVTMLTGLTPVVSFADSTTDPIKVSVSIVNAGSIEVAAEEVTVTDQNANGALDVEDVIITAHDTYFDGGAASGYATAENSWGSMSITKLWGETSSNGYGYYINNASAGSLNDTVSDGDYVCAFVYANAYPDNDLYSYFDECQASVETEEQLDLTLSYQTGYDENWDPVFGALEGATITVDGTETTYTTDEQGKVSLEFDAAGKYVVSAAKDGLTLVPPVCVVTVGEPAPDPATATVDFTAQAAGGFLCAPQFAVEVSGDLSDEYGFTDTINASEGVSALDVLIKANQKIFGDAFTKEAAADYLKLNSAGSVGTVFGIDTYAFGFAINNKYPYDPDKTSSYGGYEGYMINQAEVTDGDSLSFFIYQDTSYYSDYYGMFTDNGARITELDTESTGSVTLNVESFMYMAGYYGSDDEIKTAHGWETPEAAQLAWVDATSGELTDIAGAVTDEDGEVTFTAPAEAGTYYLTAYMPQEEITDNYASPLVMSLLKLNVTAAPNAVITVPADATLFVGQKPGNKHFVDFTEVGETRARTDATAGTKSYYYNLNNNATYNYRVSGDGYVTYAGTFTYSSSNGFDLEVTEDQLKPEGITASMVDHDVNSNNGFNVADIYLNINPQGYLKLNSAGSTYQLVNIRAWQTVDTVMNNYFIEPDYHYTVINENGSADDSVVTVDENGLIEAVGEGTAIVLVTYDAINVPSAVGGPFFGAIWPENTGVFVVSVGAGDSGINTGMTINEGMNTNAQTQKMALDALDSELDVIYFTGNTGSYTFTPESGCAVSVANPVVSDSMSFNGFAAVQASGDGSFTVPLTEGRNIVKIEKGGKAEYQVITAKKVSYTINNGDRVHAGDPVSIVFDGLYTPLNKLAGVYNMSTLAAYTKVDGYDGQLVGSTANQYKFASTAVAQTVDSVQQRTTNDNGKVTYTSQGSFAVPEDYAGDTLTLSGGTFLVKGFGSAYGSHRGITRTEGRDPNFNASTMDGFLGQLPDIEIQIADENAEVTSITAELSDSVPAVLCDGDTLGTDDLNVTANYSDGTSEKAKNFTVSPAVLTTDTTQVTVTYRGKTATVPVSVTARKVESISITEGPAKTSYKAGQTFDPTGMVVTARYNNGKTAPVTDYGYAPKRTLETSDNEVTVTYTGSDAADTSVPPSATVAITVTAAGGSGNGGGAGRSDITVYFTLLGTEKGTSDVVHTLAAGNLDTWVDKTAVTVESGSCVIDVVAKALSLNGIPYTNDGGNYISSVRGLSEFDNGANSGWMYTLNGRHPSLGIAEQTVKNGDSVVFHYTDDFTKEKDNFGGGTAAGGGSSASGTTPATENPATVPEQTPVPDPTTVIENGTPLSAADVFHDVKTDAFYSDAVTWAVLKGITKGVSDNEFGPGQKCSRGQILTLIYRALGSPAVTGSGDRFADVASDAYYHDAAVWAAEAGVTAGTSDSTFSPDQVCSRAQIVTLLWRAAGSPKVEAAGSFGDITPDMFCYDAVNWAVSKGITAGTSATTFSPAEECDRGQAVTFLYRFEKATA